MIQNIKYTIKGERMRPLRSLLFVPGHRDTWVRKAINSGPDAVILDLEDSVPTALKSEARATVVDSIARLREEAPHVGVYVRVNPMESGITGHDVAAVTVDGLDGLVLAKPSGPRDVIHLEALIDHFERVNGRSRPDTEIVVALETAEAYATCADLAVASRRVATLFAGTARDGDLARSIGYEFTVEGLESVYLRSKAILAARAAGLAHPLIGTWQDLEDTAGARLFAEQNRQLGFRGQVLIHPSHVALANEVYSPSPEQVRFYREMVDAFELAEARGDSAIRFQGMHIDYAHVETARTVLSYAEQLQAAPHAQADAHER